MNFQAVSVGEKLIENSLCPVVTGGYLDSQGTPTPSLLDEINFVDTSIGKMIEALKSTGSYNSTLIVIQHGQSPIDSSRYLGISTAPNVPSNDLPSYHCRRARLLAGLNRRRTPLALVRPKMTFPCFGLTTSAPRKAWWVCLNAIAGSRQDSRHGRDLLGTGYYATVQCARAPAEWRPARAGHPSYAARGRHLFWQ
jgi:hypothetical protein